MKCELLLDEVPSINAELGQTGAIPSAIILDHQAVSPGAFLKAVAHILEALAIGSGLPRQISLDPGYQNPTLAEREDIAGNPFTWSMFSPGFEGKNVLEMARLQTWTAKPAWR